MDPAGGTPAHLTGANVEALVATWEASLRGPKNGRLLAWMMSSHDGWMIVGCFLVYG